MATKRQIVSLLKKQYSETRSLRSVAEMHKPVPHSTIGLIINTNGQYFPKKWEPALGVTHGRRADQLPISERPARVLAWQLQHREEMK